MSALRVTVWNEFRHEQNAKHPASTIYPNGIHAVIAEGLAQQGYDVRTATLDQPEHGLTDQVLADTDVLTWWGHAAHGEVADALVEKVYKRVHEGMGLIVLHSAHFSKIFRKLMGTSCDLKWREAADKELIWIVQPGHPIAEGLPECIEIGDEEMYGEFFDIPQPDELVMVSWFSGGEVFRSGCCYTRGRGKVFYFRPGHESYPTYFNEHVRRVIANGVRWAAPSNSATPVFGNTKPRIS
ncbi:MAG: ThuA domain-containing protein [Roseiflexaceae bacterium]|nr:ThuA domain-containing protein [Roseiflexaceae bacterium]